MQVKLLELADFRNYATLTLAPGAGLNLFVGENAQGKSNLLETFYVLATTKSLRAARDSEMVSFGSDFTRLCAEIVREKQIDLTIELLISAQDKKASRLNGVKKAKLADVVGQVRASLFASADLDIVRGEPLVRRRFLDMEIGQTSPRYITALASYRKVLEQRNALLRSMRDGYGAAPMRARDILAAYDTQMAEHGAVLIERRLAFIDRLDAIASDIHRFLSDTRDTLSIGYLPSFDLRSATFAEEIREAFADRIALVGPEELARGKSLLGPQRDDLRLSVNAQDSRLFASQGQQRTIALALKLAEGRLIEELTGEPPLLLLDDVLSDLDDLRQRKLFEHVGASGSQTFLTCTSVRPIPRAMLEQASIWTIQAGTIVDA